MWLAGVKREHALLEERHQLVEGTTSLGRGRGNERLRLTARQRLLHGLVAQRREVIGNEVGHPVPKPPHRRVVEVER
jgi:hypothetical protein